jgi:hypothetical protein
LGIAAKLPRWVGMWLQTENGQPKSKGGAWFMTMFFNDKNINRHFNGQGLWYSVRCIRDQVVQ